MSNVMRTHILCSLLFLCSSLSYPQEFVDGWEKSTELYDRGMMEELSRRISDSTYRNINGIIVIKNGTLLIEQYFNGATRENVHDPRSVGKTFAAAVTGIALNEGYLNSIHQNLSEFYDLKTFANFSESKTNVTLGHLLTMSSGFDGFDFDEKSVGNEENMYPQDNWVSWTLNLPMAADRKPGEKWYYFTAGIILLGDILNKTVPGGLEHYADARLFKPLGISDYKWQYTPQNVPNTAGGIRMRALDFAKFGQLYKNKGRWNGKRILTEDWVEESFTKRFATTNEGEFYGYLWWNKSYRVNGNSFEFFYCSGNGGNKIFVSTEHPFVIVITASAYGKRYAHEQADEIMAKYVIPATIYR